MGFENRGNSSHCVGLTAIVGKKYSVFGISKYNHILLCVYFSYVLARMELNLFLTFGKYLSYTHTDVEKQFSRLVI